MFVYIDYGEPSCRNMLATGKSSSLSRGGGIRGNLFWLSRAGHPVFCKDNQTALPGAIYAGLR
ncbi:hypothetical protein [Endozoicomonas sp. ISHI1]|uniref:hypothetical protein n=1 Tax=Endozoicomonas sp. ISHI1 TaxID=2825882 RepID=UPI002147DE7F|nr:hypothetical protein [Endozoicomonas sp. ISHI1]